MLIESWILVLIMVMIFLFGLIGIGGWIREGQKLEKAKEENKRLRYQNSQLKLRIAHRNALDNIKVANEYYNNKEN